MLYINLSGRILRGKSFKELVRKLWVFSFDEKAEDKDTYMENVKKRLNEERNLLILPKDYEGFIKSLDNAGLLKICSCFDCECYNSKFCGHGLEVSGTKYECDKMKLKGM